MLRGCSPTLVGCAWYADVLWVIPIRVCVCVLLCSCQNCERKVQIAEKTVQISMNDFQERLQRCIQRCQDSAQESLPVNPSDKDVAKAQDKLANCAAACAQEYEKQIPKLQASIIDKLKHAGH